LIEISCSGCFTLRAPQKFKFLSETQSFTFGAAPSLVAGSTGTVRATATSGLAVTYSSTTASSCSITGTPPTWRVMPTTILRSRSIYTAKEVILRNVVFKVKGVEKALLAIRVKPHHIKAIRSFGTRNLTIRSINIRESHSTQ